MTSRQEDTYSYDLTALADYEPQTTQTAPPTVGVGGGRLNTPPPPTSSMSPGIGVGTHQHESLYPIQCDRRCGRHTTHCGIQDTRTTSFTQRETTGCQSDERG